MGSKRGGGAAGRRGSKGTHRKTGEEKGRRGAQRAPSGAPFVASELREAPVPGTIPRFEIPGWQERFGVVAGITARGFDLGLWTKEPVGEVMSRWLAFRRAMTGFSAIALGNQVHGVELMEIDSGRGWIHVEGIDGWISATPGILLTVTIADCVPVYLVVPGRAVALLHAGWRGTAGGILRRGIDWLLAGSDCLVSNIIMHCGIGICGDCYEVGSEVMTGCAAAAEGPGPWHLDLRSSLVEQARALGLTQVTMSPWCSAHDRTSFYSHRASGGADGRMVAYLGIPES